MFLPEQRQPELAGTNSNTASQLLMDEHHSNTEEQGGTNVISNVISANVIPAPENKEACKQFNKGVCKIHNIKGTKIVISQKKWKDRGGNKGYGYVYSRLTKYKCSGGEEADPGSGDK